ncbi:hypothetical protein QBC38DRAFT_520030 [Podospora fimiseda]|uniref:Uncharacterized protein n=1 Tax=Podospora fimiseda TaxID=252190 RepID=A0AAN7H346_9PEZI|nr:hypothetical protein QBC38DRAFT_520030 [Podospora fimiseda]
MDVTSLLNVSCGGGLGKQRRDSIASSTPSATGDTTATSTAVPTPSPERAQSRERSGSGSPTRTRNRTPWDAGGYSLPLTIDTKSIPTSADARPAFLDDSPIEGSHTSLASPVSQGAHKLSGSRSSLSSSYSSSSFSTANHSRISSLSTVSEFGSFSQPNNIGSNSCYQPSSSPYSKHQRFYSQQLTYPNPTDTIPGMADRGATGRSHDNGPCFTMPNHAGLEPDINQRNVASTHSSRSNSIAVPMRANSPSDAVINIIRRGNSGSGEPSPVGGGHGSDVNSPEDIINASPSVRSRQNVVQTHQVSPSHSAHFESGLANEERVYCPDFPDPLNQTRLYLSTTLVNLAVGPPDQVFPYQTRSEMWRRVDCRLPRICHYKLDCTINEGLEPAKQNWRKGMSHIFGRNKNETRAIPRDIWVHLCRKHYQRARYRNDEGYLRRIIFMIITQVLRAEAWSNYNLEQEHPEKGQLKGWTLHLRKRESDKRSKAPDHKIKTEPGRGTKRKASATDDEDEEDDIPAEGEQDTFSNDPPPSNVALPDWLLALCTRAPGEEPVVHTSVQIITLMQRLFDDLRPQGKGDLPDFEILPVIEGETAKSKAKTSKAKTKTVGRKASVGDSLRQKHRVHDDEGTDPQDVRFSRSDYKRAKITSHESQPQFPPRNLARTVPEMRPIVYPHRLQPEWNVSSGVRTNRSGSMDHPTSTGPLPVPAGYESRHNAHQRSVSDAGNVGHWTLQQPVTSAYQTFGYPATDSYSGYHTTDRGRNGNYPVYTQQYHQAPTWDRWSASSYGQTGYGSSMTGNHAKHVRHQSTPVVSRTMTATYAQPTMGSATHGMPLNTTFTQNPTMGGYYDHQQYDQPQEPQTQSTYQSLGSASYSNSYNGGDLPSVSRQPERTYAQADYSAQQQPLAPILTRSVDNRGYQTAGDGYQDYSSMQPTMARGVDSGTTFTKTEDDQYSRRV